MRNVRAVRVVLWGTLIFLSGCGLINALDKLKNITFMLPKRTYSVSTMDPAWKSPPTGVDWAVPCGPDAVVKDCCMPLPGVAVDCLHRSPLVCTANKCAL